MSAWKHNPSFPQKWICFRKYWQNNYKYWPKKNRSYLQNFAHRHLKFPYFSSKSPKIPFFPPRSCYRKRKNIHPCDIPSDQGPVVADTIRCGARYPGHYPSPAHKHHQPYLPHTGKRCASEWNLQIVIRCWDVRPRTLYLQWTSISDTALHWLWPGRLDINQAASGFLDNNEWQWWWWHTAVCCCC